MTESHKSSRDSRLESADQQPASGGEFALGSIGAVLLSTVGSVVASGMLPARVRIHWTLGLGSYYGPEFAPTLLVLTAFPVVIAATAFGACWVAARGRHTDKFATLRPFYVVAVFGTLIALLGAQAVIIVANL